MGVPDITDRELSCMERLMDFDAGDPVGCLQAPEAAGDSSINDIACLSHGFRNQ